MFNRVNICFRLIIWKIINSTEQSPSWEAVTVLHGVTTPENSTWIFTSVKNFKILVALQVVKKFPGYLHRSCEISLLFLVSVEEYCNTTLKQTYTMTSSFQILLLVAERASLNDITKSSSPESLRTNGETVLWNRSRHSLFTSFRSYQPNHVDDLIDVK
jgi:hypothetical protein